VVAASAAAVSAVYGIGYAVVRAATPPEQAKTALSRDALALPLAPPRGARFADGVWPGHAVNEFGRLDVAVTVRSGRITAVAITACTTYYPVSYVAGLPSEVVRTQSTDLAVVSGATGSWQDFTAAVRLALEPAVRR
jgi:uncharacterized protein with FMN-binding domain